MPLEDEPNPSSGWHLIHIAQGGEKKISADVKKGKTSTELTRLETDVCIGKMSSGVLIVMRSTRFLLPCKTISTGGRFTTIEKHFSMSCV
jgi:hypothetical protein